MATQSSLLDEMSVLSNQVAALLCAYEGFELQQDVPGIEGYHMLLRTNIYVHRAHTQRDKFTPTSFYVGASITALPPMGFMHQWLKNARESTLKTIKKGVYREEILIGGEWQIVNRRYNRWVYYDGINRKLIGQVQCTDLLVNRPALDTLRPSDAPNQSP